VVFLGREGEVGRECGAKVGDSDDLQLEDRAGDAPENPVRPGVLTIITAIGAIGLSDCMDIRVRAGSHPNEQLLEQKLVAGASTMDDVRTLLGPPFGTGSSMLPIQAGPRTMWSYYFEEGNLSDDRRMFLFVYFTPDDRYEGYLWFSSLPRD
jgi:hypothetical protein